MTLQHKSISSRMKNRGGGRRTSSPTKIIIGLALMLFAFMTCLAFIIDMHTLRRVKSRKPSEVLDNDLANVLVQQDQRVYQDPSVRFRIRIPSTWKVEYPNGDGRPYDVVFVSPYDCDISVIVSPVQDQSIQTLLRDIHSIQTRVGINMNIQVTAFKGIPAIRRNMTLHYTRVVVLDFIRDGLAHEVQLSIPHRYSGQNAEILESILDSYEPGPFTPDDNAVQSTGDPSGVRGVDANESIDPGPVPAPST